MTYFYIPSKGVYLKHKELSDPTVVSVNKKENNSAAYFSIFFLKIVLFTIFPFFLSSIFISIYDFCQASLLNLIALCTFSTLIDNLLVVSNFLCV